MVKSDEFAVLLPKDFLDEIVLFGVPGNKIVLDKSARITRVGVEAPEGVVNAVFLDKTA